MNKEELKLALENKEISIKNLAIKMHMSYAGVRRILTMPIKGEVYDPDKLNVDFLMKYILNNFDIESWDLEELKAKKKETEKVELKVNDVLAIQQQEYKVLLLNEFGQVVLVNSVGEFRLVSYARLKALKAGVKDDNQ